MATQVEFGSALTSLAGISKPRNEAAFPHNLIGSLPDASPGSLAPFIPGGRKKPGDATMPSTASRPPWTARPFSREASLDTFATVKPPVPALRPSSASPAPPALPPPFEEAPGGSSGNVPPLLDQTPTESPRGPVAHLPFCLSPQANTVILFESRGPAKGPPEEGGSKAQEGQLLRSHSEKWPRRRPSLSTNPQPAPWLPPWKEALVEGRKGSAGGVEPQQPPTLAAETHCQAGGRPAASAGFRLSWQEQTQPTAPAAASGPGTPNPRPLPTDLAGRFASQELSRQKMLGLADSTERSFLAAGERAPEAAGARSPAAGSSGAAPGAESARWLAEFPQSCLPAAGVAPPGQAPPEDSGPSSTKEAPGEPRGQGRPSAGQQKGGTGLPLGERGEVAAQGAGLRSTEALDGKRRACGQTAVPLLEPAAKPWAPRPSPSLAVSPRQEVRVLNIQQRIQVLTAENAGFKAGSLRASFRSRPLSADLTKVFSGPETAGELKAKRQPGEIRDAAEDETLPVAGKDVGEAGLAGSSWRPPPLAKSPSIEGAPETEGARAKGRLNSPFPGKGPGLVLSPKARSFSASSTEDACPQTVRATIFEHHVERHSVVTSQRGSEPASLSLMAPSGESASRGQESGAERVPGAARPSRGSPRGGDAWQGGRGPRDPRPLAKDEGSPAWAEGAPREKDEQRASRGTEDALPAQRIEPRYEVLQTVGERAQSEAVAAVSGGKAIPLRRQKPLKENQRAGGYGRSKGWSGAPAPGTGPSRDLPAFGSQAAFPGEGAVLEKNRAGQQPASEKAASFRMKEDSHSAPWLDTNKERWLAPAAVRDRVPQRAGARPAGADGRQGEKTSPLQRGSCPGLLFGLDLKPPQGPDGQELRLAGYAAQEGVAEGKALPGSGMEERWTSSFRNVSAPRGSGRWRRKTLPHSTAGLGPRQAEVTSPSSLKKPLSPSEPKATYFAVTCQISEEKINNQPGRAAALAPPASTFRRADPSDCQHRECFSEGGSCAGGPLSRPGTAREASDRLATGASREPLSEARDQGQELLQSGLEAAAEGRLARADPPFSPGTRSPPPLAPLQRESQQKRSGVLDFGRVEKKAPDRYRARVVDIDQLMAEYAEESQKLCEREGQRERSSFPWEKWPPRRNFSGNLPCSSAQRDQGRVEHSLGSRGLGTGASSGEGSRVRESDPLEIQRQESGAREGAPELEKPSFLAGREGEAGPGQGAQSAKDAAPGPHPACLGPTAWWKEAGPKQWAVLAPASSDWDGRGGWRAQPGLWAEGSPAAHPGPERSPPTASPPTGATPDLKRSSSGKALQSQARPGAPSGPRLDQPRVCQRFPAEGPGDWPSKAGPSPRDRCSRGGARDLGEEGLTVEREDAATTKRALYPLAQRRSQSFYKERRSDRWSGDRLKACFGRPSPEARDTDVLVQETDSRYGSWGDQPRSGVSFTTDSPSWGGSVAPVQKPPAGRRASLRSSQSDLATAADQQDPSREQRSPRPDDSSPEADSASLPTEEPSPDFSFLEHTPRLDSGTLKSRVLLGKRRQQRRAPISRTLRRNAGGDAQPPFSAAEGAVSAWMFTDSTG